MGCDMAFERLTPYNTKIDVVGSRAAGQGRNIDNEALPTGKGEGKRSDIDFRIDGKHPRAKELIAELKEVGNGAGSAGEEWSTTDRATRPPSITFSPAKE